MKSCGFLRGVVSLPFASVVEAVGAGGGSASSAVGLPPSTDTAADDAVVSVEADGAGGGCGGSYDLGQRRGSFLVASRAHSGIGQLERRCSALVAIVANPVSLPLSRGTVATGSDYSCIPSA